VQIEPEGERELDFEPEPDLEPEIEHAPRFYRDETPTFEEPVTYEPELEWEAEPDTAEIEAVQQPVAVAHEPVQHELDGVTESADWGWDDPEDFSAPV
jgi:hypothetical protein